MMNIRDAILKTFRNEFPEMVFDITGNDELIQVDIESTFNMLRYTDTLRDMLAELTDSFPSVKAERHHCTMTVKPEIFNEE